MGNQNSAAHALKPRKNVHWKSAGRPAAPGRPEAEPAAEEGAVALRWTPASDGGATLLGYQVECQVADGGEWLRTAPPLVQRPELVLAGLPPQRYQFRVAALSAAGVSDYSAVSMTVTVGATGPCAPKFIQLLQDVCALEGESAEFRTTFKGTPPPTIAWFKDDYEIFSSRRTVITSGDGTSVLVFHQTLASDEGEVKCTATNRAGHAVTRARLRLEAPPRLRYPRQYEDGLLYEVNETIYLKTTVVGRPAPDIEWRHDGNVIKTDARVQLAYSGGVASLKIMSAQRSDRGEYQVRATSRIGEDSAAFLVTVTAPPEPPRALAVVRQLDRSVTLRWQEPADDGGCRVGNYVVEYYRAGWDVWLKATTSRQATVTLYDLIEGSEYRFRVKAESPYGMSAPSAPSATVRVSGAPRDADSLAIEKRILATTLRVHDGETASQNNAEAEPQSTSNEFLLVLCPSSNGEQPQRRASVSGHNKSVDHGSDEALLEGEAEEPPPLSFSAPELSSRTPAQQPPRLCASSTDLLHERAMLRMYHAVALRDERTRNNPPPQRPPPPQHPPPIIHEPTPPPQHITSSQTPPSHASFEEDYTASTVSTDYSDEEPTSLEQSVTNDTPPAPEEMSTTTETPPPSETPPRALPDPTFVPKPILKRREPDTATPEHPPLPLPPTVEKEKQQKTSIFKKFTKMPVQKPFPFPKILHKKQPKVTPPPLEATDDDTPKPKKIIKPTDNKINDEAVIVIEHYGNIVKEYGRNKRPTTPLYLNTEDLKHAAERQQSEEPNENDPVTPARGVQSTDTTVTNEHEEQKQTKQVRGASRGRGGSRKTRGGQSGGKNTATSNETVRRRATAAAKPANSQSEPTETETPSPSNSVSTATTAVLLRTAPRATLVIPIDYANLEQQATASVRTAIDCTVDGCLLILAFYLYLFRDERLVLGPLALLASRQLRAIARWRLPPWLCIPAWMRLPS